MRTANRIQRLGPVRRVAEQKEQEAAPQLADTIRALRDAEGALAQLIQYRANYVRGDRKPRVDAIQWQDYHAFIAKLDQAIGGQQAIIEDQRQRVGNARAHWQVAHARVSALVKLTQKLQDTHRQLMERRAQRELDERSQQHSVSQPFGR